MQSHFIFWQQYVSSPQGQMFCQFYGVTKRPVVMILDADTRAQLKQWSGFVEPDVLLDRVTSFVEEHQNSHAAKTQRAADRVASLRDPSDGGGAMAPATAVACARPLTEEEELDAAIRASMGGADDSLDHSVEPADGNTQVPGEDGRVVAAARLGAEPAAVCGPSTHSPLFRYLGALYVGT